MSAELVDVGMLAAKAAKDRRPEDVLSAGEQVYNVCTRCHMKYLIDAIQ
jgi:cytochrome c2